MKHTSTIDRHLYSPAAQVCSESPAVRVAWGPAHRRPPCNRGRAQGRGVCPLQHIGERSLDHRSTPVSRETPGGHPTTALRDYRPEPIVFSLHDAIHALRTGMPFVRRTHDGRPFHVKHTSIIARLNRCSGRACGPKPVTVPGAVHHALAPRTQDSRWRATVRDGCGSCPHATLTRRRTSSSPIDVRFT